MRIEEFNFPSADNNTEIHSVRWIPDGEITGILQLCHGMAEYILRYGEFAEYLTDRGILVTGNDHLGHGRSVSSDDLLFHFPQGGNRILLKDIHRLRSITETKYPNLPYFILGHSMGSFLVRQYICMQGEGLSGVVIMGTGEQSKATLDFAKNLSATMGLIKKPDHHSVLINALAFGSYNSKIDDPKNSFEWLSRDEAKVKKYLDDPLCGGIFTYQAFAEMFKSMIYLKKKENLKNMPKTLPMLFVSGDADPVGDYGKGVKKAASKCIDAGIENVTCHLYEGARHEILNETNRMEVYEDIYTWIQAQLDIIG